MANGAEKLNKTSGAFNSALAKYKFQFKFYGARQRTRTGTHTQQFITLGPFERDGLVPNYNLQSTCTSAELKF